MSIDEIKALLERTAEEIYNKGNLAYAEKVYTADIVRHDPTQPEPLRGVAATKENLQRIQNAFPDGRLTVEDTVVEGNRFANRWTFSGTHQGEFAGVPATGEAVTMTGMSFGRVEDGKIAEVWDQPDVLGLLQQVGAIPTPKQA